VTAPIAAETRAHLAEAAQTALHEGAGPVMVLSDCAKGVLAGDPAQALIKAAGAAGRGGREGEPDGDRDDRP
jgi:hypothetical protein